MVGIDSDDGERSEQLFARQLGPHRFELCCIPFFTYVLSLGDIVETDESYNVIRVAARSRSANFSDLVREDFLPEERGREGSY